MDYFVSAEDTPFYHWQLELLIHSFHLQGLRDSLVICLASATGPTICDFRKLLMSHPRILLHDNVGQQRGYRYLNKIYGITAALAQGMLKVPFCVIEPDMVMVRPVETGSYNISVQVKPSLTLEECERNGLHLDKYLQAAGKEKVWMPLGSVYAFNNVPDQIFSRIADWIELLVYENCKTKEEFAPWKHVDRAGWALGLMEYYGHLSFKSRHDFEMTLLDHRINHNFIHYSHGLPPVFSKFSYKYEPPDHMASSDSPYLPLLEHNPTTSTNFLQQVVRSYLALDGGR